jgi:hypothetical protein
LGMNSRPTHTRTGSEFDPDARNSEPSPDVNLDLSSVEDATGGGDILTRDYIHPLAAAQLAPGKMLVSGQGQVGKAASVRSRGRVPDALEVLPLDEHAWVLFFFYSLYSLIMGSTAPLGHAGE